MIEISKEEFVKRYRDKYPDRPSNDDTDWFWNGERAYADIEKYSKDLDFVLLDREGWEKIKTLIENMPDGLELNASDIPSINVPMLKDTKFLLFRKDKFNEFREKLKELMEE